MFQEVLLCNWEPWSFPENHMDFDQSVLEIEVELARSEQAKLNFIFYDQHRENYLLLAVLALAVLVWIPYLDFFRRFSLFIVTNLFVPFFKFLEKAAKSFSSIFTYQLMFFLVSSFLFSVVVPWIHGIPGLAFLVQKQPEPSLPVFRGVWSHILKTVGFSFLSTVGSKLLLLV